MDETDERAFADALERHRRELLVHCYRMLGSTHEAEDLVQDTMARAWRARASYDPERASVRTWLYRIATNACLTALEGRARRPLPAGSGPVFDDPAAPFVPGFEVPWLEPLPDAVLAGAGSPPDDPAAERGDLRLAVVAALQLLGARQRAVLILRESLGLPAAEVADALDMSVPAVNSALQRARATLAEAGADLHAVPEPLGEQRAVVDRYVAAFERADVAGMTRLLADAVVLEMPPMWNWYVGRHAYGGFMRRVFEMRGERWRFLPVGANGQPAVAAYSEVEGTSTLHTLQVFDVMGGEIVRTTVYQVPTVLDLFDLPPTLGHPPR